MKPYFAQYLPVHDDTYREDDLFIFKVNGDWTKPMGALDLIGYQIEEGKKVRLFLCSNLVVAGDEVYAEPDAIGNHEKGLRFTVEEIDVEEGYRNAKIKYTAHPRMPKAIGNIRDWPADNLWKVIGEILTPDIVDGQQFSETEIRNLQLKSQSGEIMNPNITNKAYRVLEDINVFPLSQTDLLIQWVDEGLLQKDIAEKIKRVSVTIAKKGDVFFKSIYPEPGYLYPANTDLKILEAKDKSFGLGMIIEKDKLVLWGDYVKNNYYKYENRDSNFEEFETNELTFEQLHIVPELERRKRVIQKEKNELIRQMGVIEEIITQINTGVEAEQVL